MCDPETGLCANDSRFSEADVVQAVAAFGAGRLTVTDIDRLTAEFLASPAVVRLSVEPEEARRTPPQWTTTAHLALESIVLECVDTLVERTATSLDARVVDDAITA